MIHSLTSWDLGGESLRCKRCSGSADLFNIANDPEDLQQLRTAKTAELNLMKMSQLKTLCTEHRLKTMGNKEALVKRLVAEDVASADPLERHAQYRRQLEGSATREFTPPMYSAYREHFNAVDIFNKRFYSLRTPKTRSELTHIFFGMITMALVNTYTIVQCDQPEFCQSQSVANQLSEE